MIKGTLWFHLVAFCRRGQDQTVRAWTVSQLQKGHVERRRLGRNGEECAQSLATPKLTPQNIDIDGELSVEENAIWAQY